MQMAVAPGARHGPPSACLQTSRMVLRRLTSGDLDDLAGLYGDPQVMRFIDDGTPVPPDVVAQHMLPGLLAEYRDGPAGHGCFAAVDKAAGAFLGTFSLRATNSIGLSGGTEIGYRCSPAAWGHGYAAEGAAALVRHAFTTLGSDRVVATTMTVNTTSRRVLHRAGLLLVRTFFAPWPAYIDGAEHGDVVYELTRDQWLRQRRTGPP